jgi:branched-chain amino acid transport system ATP-binding protein
VEDDGRLTALLELEGIRKAFGRVVVADDLSFSVARGETLGIVGPNGAGKTSLLNLITGSLAPNAGRILLDGVDLARMPAHARARRGVARTYQIPRPFSGLTVFENVLLAASYAGTGPHDPAATTAVSVSALERTELLPRANQLAEALPLLDRKRLELARALGARPTLLLLDEIAGGLTEAEVDALVATIRALKADGLTIVWVEHIVEALVSVVDRLMAMDVGRKLAEGEPREVLARPEVQAVYLGQEAIA